MFWAGFGFKLGQAVFGQWQFIFCDHPDDEFQRLIIVATRRTLFQVCAQRHFDHLGQGLGPTGSFRVHQLSQSGLKLSAIEFIVLGCVNLFDPMNGG
jgi:hypothetical protein